MKKLLITLIIISANLLAGCDQLISAPTYSLFNCQNNKAQTEEACNRVFTGTVKVNVNKNKPEVILVFTDPSNNQQNLKKLEQCTAIDNLNWQCGEPDEIKLIAGTITSHIQHYVYRSSNGNITISDMRVSYMGRNGYSEHTTYKAALLKRN